MWISNSTPSPPPPRPNHLSGSVKMSCTFWILITCCRHTKGKIVCFIKKKILYQRKESFNFNCSYQSISLWTQKTTTWRQLTYKAASDEMGSIMLWKKSKKSSPLCTPKRESFQCAKSGYMVTFWRFDINESWPFLFSSSINEWSFMWSSMCLILFAKYFHSMHFLNKKNLG